MGHLGLLLFLFSSPLTCLCAHGPPSCGKDEFACGSRGCVPLRFRCDEMSCHNCTAFSCGQADKCLSRTQLCDGRADCRDGRDESPKLCASSRPNAQACKSSEFRCGDGPCVAQTYRCDNWKDCADGSDEVDCDQNECAVDNGGCSHGCRDLPLGFICECPRDMVLVGEYQCEEVDACLDADVCDQVCIPANGSLTCGCHQDYKMSPTTGECKAKGDEARVVFTSSQGLRWTSISGGESGEPAQQFPGPGLVVGLAANGTLYWAPQGCGTIYRVSMNERNGDPLPALRVQGPVSGLAVDWIHRLLYWASAGSGSVHVGLLDGSAQRALVAGLQTPSAVAVDPLHRWNLVFRAGLTCQRGIVHLSPFHFSGSSSGLSLVTPRRLREAVWMVGTGRLWSHTPYATPWLCLWICPGSCSTGPTREPKPSPGSTLRAATVGQWWNPTVIWTIRLDWLCLRVLYTGATRRPGPSAGPVNTTGGTSQSCCQTPTRQGAWPLCSRRFSPKGRLRAATRGGSVGTGASSTSCPTARRSGAFLQEWDKRALRRFPPSPALSPLPPYQILHLLESSLFSCFSACCWWERPCGGGEASFGCAGLSSTRASPSKSPRTRFSRWSHLFVQTRVSERKLCLSWTWTLNEEALADRQPQQEPPGRRGNRISPSCPSSSSGLKSPGVAGQFSDRKT